MFDQAARLLAQALAPLHARAALPGPAVAARDVEASHRRIFRRIYSVPRTATCDRPDHALPAVIKGRRHEIDRLTGFARRIRIRSRQRYRSMGLREGALSQLDDTCGGDCRLENTVGRQQGL